MIDSKQLLADLKRLRKRLEDELPRYHAASAGREAVLAEWRAAFEARRTADTFETFWSAALDQAAVHWILGVVFLRFLEDNRLLDRPLLSGPGERLELAQLRQREFFRARPHDSDAEFLLETFAEAARLPGLAGLYDPAHNPLFRLPLSGDGAMALLGFFRERVPETGALVHDFADPEWGTRFLGDLYQDLSEEARKRYALLQTPEFVEELNSVPHARPGDRRIRLCGGADDRPGLRLRPFSARRFCPAAGRVAAARAGNAAGGAGPKGAGQAWRAWTSIRSPSRSRGSGCCSQRC